MADHSCGYREAFHSVLAADPELARSLRDADGHGNKAQARGPCGRDDEAEILDWVLRSVRDGHPGALPGALGQLSIEADTFAKLGMPVEEAVKRAMDGNPHLVTMAKLLLADIRRNAPGSADKAPRPRWPRRPARSRTVEHRHSRTSTRT